MSKVTFPSGVKDELGTEELLKSMLGKVYTVQGFDKSHSEKVTRATPDLRLGYTGVDLY